MIRFRRSRFHEVVSRQLDLFAADEAALIDEARAAEEAWTRAGREDAEEAYGDWQLVADTIGDRLLDVREAYAGTLDDSSADEYRSAFKRVASSRLGNLAALLDD